MKQPPDTLPAGFFDEEEEKEAPDTLPAGFFGETVPQEDTAQAPEVLPAGFFGEEVKPSVLESTVRGAAQGLTMDFADEATGAVEALFTSKTYKQARDESRLKYEQAAKANPKAYLAGEVVGGLATTFVPILKATQMGAKVGMGVKAAAVAGAKAGAVGGALVGAGKSADIEEVDQFAKDVLVGGAVGGVAGGALGAAFPAIKATYQGAKNASNRLISHYTKAHADLAEGAASLLSKNAPTEQALKDVVLDATNRNQFLEEPATFVAELGEEQIKKLAYLGEAVPKRQQKPEKLLQMATSKVMEQQQKFGTFLMQSKAHTAKNALDAIQKIDDAGMLEDSWRSFRLQENMLEYVRANNISKMPSIAPNLRAMGNFFSDAQYVYQRIDDKLGTSLQPTLNKLHQKHDRLTYELDMFRKGYLDPINDMLKSGKVDQNKVFDALDKGNNVSMLNPEESQIYNHIRKTTDYMRKIYADYGMTVEKVKNYFPGRMVSVPDYVVKTRQYAQDMLDSLEIGGFDEIDKGMFKKLMKENPEFGDLVQALRFSSTKQASSGRELQSQLMGLGSREAVGKRLTTQAQALFEKEKGIPDFLREKDFQTVLSGSFYNNLRHALFADTVQEMAAHVPVLKKLDNTYAEYVARHLQDIAGVPRKEWMPTKAMRDVSHAAQIKLTEAMQKYEPGSWQRNLLEIGRDTPNLLQSMASNVYPNYLGYNPRAAIRNLTQPYVMTSAQLIGNDPKAIAKANKYALMSSLDTIAAKRSGKDLAEELVQMGWRGGQHRSETSTFSKAVQESTPWKLSQDAITKINEWGMYLYDKSDVINRYTTVKMAERILKDVAAGDEVAKQMVGRMPRGYRIKFQQAKTPEAQAKIFTDYLISTTQFNYSKVSLSEFGRSMGPIFAVFTKWPASIAGDIVSTMTAADKSVGNKAGTLGMKYVAPIMGLTMLDYALFGSIKGPEDPRTKKLVGASGFKSIAPLTAVPTEVPVPPVINTALTVLPALTSDKDGAFTKWLNDATYAFAPGMGPIRFADDVMTVIENKKQEGIVTKALKDE